MKNLLRNRSTTKLGCGFLLGLGGMICVLFVLNLMFVKAFVVANFPGIDFRYSQAAYSIMPVLLIFFEFWLYDLITSGRYHKGD